MIKKESLLSKWKNSKQSKGTSISAISPLPAGQPVPLSFGQQRLWFLQQLHPENPFYHYADAYKFEGNLALTRLLDCFQTIAERHEIFRTIFAIENERVVQKITDKVQIESEVIDLRHLSAAESAIRANELAVRAANRYFDLENGPLTRIMILQLSDTETLLVLIMHHIITDKASMRILQEELATYYIRKSNNLSTTLTPLNLQYGDFAHWQTTRKQSKKSLDYWETKLAGNLPILNLPTDYLRPAKPSYKGAYHKNILPTPLLGQLENRAKQANTTLFVLLLTAYKVLLYRYSGQEDVLIGTPITNRDQVVFEKLIGFFNNTVVLRSDLSNNPSFSNLLNQVRKTTLEAFSNNNIPFETLVQKLNPQRQMSINPIFQSMFLFEKETSVPYFGEHLKVKYTLFDFDVSKFDLTLYISKSKEELVSNIEYATDLFEPATIERMQIHYQTLLESIVANPQETIANLPMLPDSEEKLIIETWNDTTTPLTLVANIHSLIEKQAVEQPNKVAVTFENQHLTYEQLDQQANKIAHYLLNLADEHPLVGLSAKRSIDMIVGIVGILKAGKAYVPLDPEYPDERIKLMVNDADLSVILTQNELLANFKTTKAKILSIEKISATTSSVVSLPDVKSSDIAYVIYTSGSTGKPKGVVVNHANLVHSTCTRFDFYPTSPNVFLLLSSFAFDSSIVGIFWTLCSGGKLILPKYRVEQDLEELGNLVAKQKVTHTLLLPSLYSLLLQYIPSSKLASLNTVIVAGEICSSALCQQHYQKFPEEVSLYNEYGPTEASVWCTAHLITREDTNRPTPIGRPISNTRTYILDKKQQPVPIGISGELYIGGAGVTQGYWNQPELTAERFIQNPFGREGKLYRTGDLAQYRADGTIDFLGRTDSQVKVRGYRIELEEIRAAIEQQEGIEEAVVTIHKEKTRPVILETSDDLTTLLGHLEAEIAVQMLEAVENLSEDKVALLLKEFG